MFARQAGLQCCLRPHGAATADATSGSIVLAASGIGKSFGPTRCLIDVTLRLFRGEIHALLGENGAGKSTPVKIPRRSPYPRQRGDRAERPTHRAVERHRGVASGIVPIYQELSLFPHLTVAENMAAFDLAGGPGWRLCRSRSWRRRAVAALEELGLPFELARTVGELSLEERASSSRSSARWGGIAPSHPGRAVRGAHRRRGDAPIRRNAERRRCGAGPCCSSAIAWTRSSRSQTASPSCATASWFWTACRAPTCRRTRSSRP